MRGQRARRRGYVTTGAYDVAGDCDNLQATWFRNIPLPSASAIKQRPIALILTLLGLILVVPALDIGVLLLEGPRLRNEALANLAAIGRLKADQVETWLTDHRSDAEMLMIDEGLVDDAQSWFDRRDPGAQARIAQRDAALRHTNDYQDMELLDVRAVPDNLSPVRRALLTAALAGGRLQTGYLYRDSAGEARLDLVVPLIKHTPRGQKAIGAVMLGSLANTYLFPLIQTWPTTSPSAETLLVRRDGDSVLFLNELRHRPGTSLSFRLPLATPDLPAAIAIRDGRIQTFAGHDYRGAPVLAAVRPVVGTDWFLVSKVDLDEVQRPLYQLVTWVSAVALTAILVIGITLLRLWRQQARSHRLELIDRTTQQERLLGLFYDLPFMGMGIVDPKDLHWLHVNDRLCEILGYSREELLAFTSCEQITHPEDLAEEKAQLQRMLAGEINDYQMEKRLLRKDDGYIDVALSVKCVRRGDGSVEHIVKTVRDITERKRLESARTEQQRTANLLDAIVTASTDAIFVKDREGNYLFYNREAARAANKRIEEVIGHNDLALFPPELAARIMAEDRGVMAGGETITFEHELATAYGDRTFLTTKGPLRDNTGKVIGLFGISHDITERKIEEEQVRRSQAQLQLFIEHAPIGIAMFDRGMNTLAYSHRWLEAYGRGYDNLVGRNHYLMHPDMPDAWREIHARGLAGETLKNDVDHWIQADGSEHWLRWAVLPWKDANGAIGGILISAEDITDRVLADKALATSNARLSGVVESAMDAIISIDARQQVRLFNPAAERIFGCTQAEALGQPIEHFVPVRFRQSHAEHLRRFATTGVTSRSMGSLGELFALRCDGSEFPIEASISQADLNGERLFTVIMRDITERKQAEAALRYQLDLTRSITEKATDSIFINDAEGRVTALNAEAEKAFGYSADELVGRVLHDVIHHHHRDGRPFPMDECPLCRVYKTGEMIRDHEAIVFRKDGSQMFVTGSNAALESGGKLLGAALILHDITKLKQVEQDLKRAQAVGRIGSWRLNVQRNQLTWSAENHRIFGIAEGTPLTYETFLTCVHPDDRAYVDQEWQAGLRGEPYDIEHRLLVYGQVKWVREKAELEFAPDGNLLGGFGITQDITDVKQAEQALRDSEERFQLATEIGRSGTWDWDVRSGEIIWSRGHYDILGYREGEVVPSFEAWAERVHPDDRERIEAEVRRCMLEQADYSVQFRVVWPDGSIHWMISRGRYEYDQGGRCQRMVGVMADITTLKQAELALREADQRKDEFLAMLAHELRNPLAPIRNAAHVLGRLELAEPRLRWAQDIIERQVSHLTHLVDELLDVSRIVRGKIVLKKTCVELADLVHQASESVQPIMTQKGHRFEVRMPDARVVLDGDLVRLVQVLQNLLNNAAKYTPDGGHIELLGHLRESQIEIVVRDNGMGITADLLPAVFDLFRQGERTLDRSQGGLGIGLTLVRRLVELHGGRIEARSAGPGQGSTFAVLLPLADATTEEASTPSAEKTGEAPKRLRVLIVDDDPVVAESMLVFLELEGHQVRSADSGDAALRLLAEFRPRVVLLDIGLPDQDGYAVARRIRQLPGGEELMLVAVSGYGHEEAVERSWQAGFDRHLVKPVDPEKLCELLAAVNAT